MWVDPCVDHQLFFILCASLTIDWNGWRVPFTFHLFTYHCFLLICAMHKWQSWLFFSIFIDAVESIYLLPNCLFIRILNKEKRPQWMKSDEFCFYYYWGFWHALNCSIFCRLFFPNPLWLQLPTEKYADISHENCPKKKGTRKKCSKIKFVIEIYDLLKWWKSVQRNIFLPHQQPFISLSTAFLFHFNVLFYIFLTLNFGIIGLGCRYIHRYTHC